MGERRIDLCAAYSITRRIKKVKDNTLFFKEICLVKTVVYIRAFCTMAAIS